MLRLAFKIGLTIILLGVISCSAIILFVWPNLPDIESLRDVKIQTPLRIYSSEGAFISEIGEVRRVPLPISAIPPKLIKAVLATEDYRFYEHPGVDWRGIARAVVNLVKTGRKSQGGSTITMQLARHFYYTREKKFSRKFNEIFLSTTEFAGSGSTA